MQGIEVQARIKEAVRTFEKMPTIPGRETQRRELSFKDRTRVLESAGILFTHCASPTAVNLIHKESSWISPLVEKLLEEYSQRLKTPGIEKEIDWDAKD